MPALSLPTGMDTELGHISRLVAEAETEVSPLEKKLALLSGQLVWLTLTLTALIGGIGFLQGKDAFLMVEARISRSPSLLFRKDCRSLRRSL